MKIIKINPLLLCFTYLFISGCFAQPNDINKVKDVEAVTVDPSLQPLPIELTGKIEVLPEKFPETWMFVDESSFTSQFGGKMIVLDVAEPKASKRIKGTSDKNLIGSFVQSKTRSEYYIAESFHERGSRGPKVDILVFYDKKTLSPTKEIILQSSRLVALPRRHAMTLSEDEKFLYIANFSPAASFSVVDLDRKEVVDTIGTPGCVLTFPTGTRGITSICSNGSLLTTIIDEHGKKLSQHRVPQFFDTDKTPIFERPAIINNIAYFPSFTGDMHVINLQGKVAKHEDMWSLFTPEEQASGWRPGGLSLVDNDENGLLYIIMNPEGFDGSQTHGGTEIWVFDPVKKKRLSKFPVPKWAVSVALTRGKEPLVVVTNGEMSLDIFNPRTGELVHNLDGFGNISPIIIFKAY